MSPVCALNVITNINKHRFLVETGIRAGYFSLQHVSGPKTIRQFKSLTLGGGGHTVKTVPGDAPVGENEIGLYASLVAPQTHYDVDISIDIKFTQIDGLQPYTCLYHLQRFLKSCRDIRDSFILHCESISSN